jgi:hypothetical protein
MDTSKNLDAENLSKEFHENLVLDLHPDYLSRYT